MNHLVSIFENYRKQTNSFICFLAVGVINTVVGLSFMFLIMNGFGWSYYMATFTGNGIGAVVSYILNRSFTFRSEKSISNSAPLFILVVTISYVSAYTLSNILAGKIGVDTGTRENMAVIIGTGFYTIFNYLGQKHLVFYKK